MIGGITGAVLSAGGKGKALKEMRETAPDYEKVALDVKQAYKALEDAGIQYSDNSYKSFAMKTAHELNKRGFRPRDGDPISGDIKDILGRMNKPNDYAELESLRRRLGNLPTNASKQDRAHATFLKRQLDEFMDNAANVVSTKNIPKDQIAALYKSTRELASRKIKADKIDEMNEGRIGYLGGEESAMRNQFGSYLRNKDKRRGLTTVEKQSFGKVVSREGVENAAHLAGSRAGQLIGGGTSAVVGGAVGSVIPGVGTAIGALAGPAINFGITTALRNIMRKSTDKKVQDAIKTVLAGKNAQEVATAAENLAKRDSNIRKLLATEGAFGSLSGKEPVFFTDSKGRNYGRNGLLLTP
jgi:hypothetical protein